jgi:hypothetical protein
MLLVRGGKGKRRKNNEKVKQKGGIWGILKEKRGSRDEDVE